MGQGRTQREENSGQERGVRIFSPIRCVMMVVGSRDDRLTLKEFAVECYNCSLVVPTLR